MVDDDFVDDAPTATCGEVLVQPQVHVGVNAIPIYHVFLLVVNTPLYHAKKAKKEQKTLHQFGAGLCEKPDLAWTSGFLDTTSTRYRHQGLPPFSCHASCG